MSPNVCRWYRVLRMGRTISGSKLGNCGKLIFYYSLISTDAFYNWAKILQPGFI